MIFHGDYYNESMTATAHAVVGTFFAARIADPVIALPLSFISHYALDTIPHWDTATNRKSKSEKRLLIESTIDGVIAIVLSLGIYTFVFNLDNYLYLGLIVGASVFPDILTVLTRFIVKKHNVLWNWNNRLQIRLNRRMQLPWGILTQVAAVGIVYVLLFSVFV